MEEFDKSEKATPYKLEQARRKGNVARSADATGGIVLLVAAVALYAWGWDAGEQLLQLTKVTVAQGLQSELSAAFSYELIRHLGVGALAVLAPFMAAVAIAAIFANIVQTGFIWSAHPLKPDLNRINPVTGAKRLFSLKTLYEAVKSIIKLVVLCTALYFSLKTLLAWFFVLGEKTAYDGFHIMIDSLGSLAIKLAACALLLGLLDIGYTRFEFARKMRMSQRDIKDEVKHRDGDPRIRSRLRSLRLEMLKKASAVPSVGQADVLIVNPTHIAVALQYRRDEMNAPIVLAKGAGALARRLREEAARRSIPIVRNPTLARALYFQGDIRQPIPDTLYEDVARVIVWVLAMRRAKESYA